MKLIRVLLPFSLLSFLLSYSYSCLPCYLHSITSLLHTLNHLSTRKAMFLLAHAILLYLAKTSGLLRAGAPVNNTLHVPHDDDRRLFVLPADASAEVVEKRVIEESVVLRRVNYVRATEPTSVEGRIKRLAVAVVDMELVIVDELELLAVDELNKRFDEFIEREKKRRAVEALQLVVV